MWVRRSDFNAHIENDAAQFKTIIDSLKSHDENVDVKHAENKKVVIEVRDAQQKMQTTLDDIVKLRPDIERGIAAAKQEDFERQLAAQRRASARRLFGAIVATAAAVGGLIPLFQWIATVHVQFHLG